MGKVHKMVWRRGKNLKPAPKGRMPLQLIPGPRPKTAQDRRKKLDYQLAISQDMYPRGEPMGMALLASVRQEVAQLIGIKPEMMQATETRAEPTAVIVGPGVTASAIASMAQLLRAAPAPSREPIEVTEAQYQALIDLPTAETPAELGALVSTFGTAVVVVKPTEAPLTGKLT